MKLYFGSMWNRVGNQFATTAHPSGEWTEDVFSIFLLFKVVLIIIHTPKHIGTLEENDYL